MNIQAFSRVYKVAEIRNEDIPAVLQVCRKNPRYYKYCPPAVSEESIREDMAALPPGKTCEDKFYIGFWEKDQLVAVMDVILQYPNKETAFIGFFMMNYELQGKGIGSQIITDCLSALKTQYKYVRLGYMKGNRQSGNFWKKNGFIPTGIVAGTDSAEIIVLEKEL